MLTAVCTDMTGDNVPWYLMYITLVQTEFSAYLGT